MARGKLAARPCAVCGKPLFPSRRTQINHPGCARHGEYIRRKQRLARRQREADRESGRG